jgi:hypothetical protein
MCDHVAIMDGGVLKAAGTVDEVRGERSLEEVFVDTRAPARGGQGSRRLPSGQILRCGFPGPGTLHGGLAAAMRRSTWTLVGTILGGLYLLGLVVFWGGMAWVGGGGGPGRRPTSRSWRPHRPARPAPRPLGARRRLRRPMKGPSAAATARLVVGLKARLTAAAMRRSTWTLVGNRGGRTDQHDRHRDRSGLGAASADPGHAAPEDHEARAPDWPWASCSARPWGWRGRSRCWGSWR